MCKSMLLVRQFPPIITTVFLLVTVLVAVSIISSPVCGEPYESDFKIRPVILTGQGLETNYVGDYFWYDVQLENNSTVTINATFTVRVYNTTHGLVPPIRDYTTSLKPGGIADVYPNYTREGREEYSIFFFNSPGTYELDVSSNAPVAFYEYFADGKYIVQHSLFRFYFDALPASEKVLDDRMQAWIQKNEQWIEQSRQIALEETRSTHSMLVLTEAMFLVTLVNTSLVVWSTRAQANKRASLFFYVYLGAVLGFFILIMLGVPILFLGG